MPFIFYKVGDCKYSSRKIRYFNTCTSSYSTEAFSGLVTVQPTSVLTKASVWYEIRVLWANINHIKSHAMALAFCLQPDSRLMCPGPGWSGRYFSTYNFDLWYFCSLLTYKSVQYLIWKIWFISIWRMKFRALAWLLTWFMFAQSTLILYRTKVFVKTEVGCTVSGN